MTPKNLLTNNELQALRPEERVRYVHKRILDSLDIKKDKTLSEIIEVTGLARPTVTKHLGLLVALQQVKKEERGLGRNKISFYKKIGNVLENNQFTFEADDTTYSFFTLEDDEGKAICIQQKQEDEYKTSSVRGTIVIKYDYAQQFIKELNTYAVKVIRK